MDSEFLGMKVALFCSIPRFRYKSCGNVFYNTVSRVIAVQLLLFSVWLPVSELSFRGIESLPAFL